LGDGYLGGPIMYIIALKCSEIKVTVVHLNEERFAAWNDEDLEKLPVYDPALSVIGIELQLTGEGIAECGLVKSCTNLDYQLVEMGKEVLAVNQTN
jgi:hypothetical protein